MRLIFFIFFLTGIILKMNKEIVIGRDIKPNFNSYAMWDYSKITENKTFYILRNDLFNISVYVVKDSDEGNQIDTWIKIEENRNNEKVEEKALELYLPYATTEEIVKAINGSYDEGFKDGYKNCQCNIRKALGFNY